MRFMFSSQPCTSHCLVPCRPFRPLKPTARLRDVLRLCQPDRDQETTSRVSTGSIQERAGKLAADLAVNPLTYLVAIVFSVWLVNVLGESDLTIFVLAAFPIVGLTALSKSPIGEEVQKSLEAELPGTPCRPTPRGGDDPAGPALVHITLLSPRNACVPLGELEADAEEMQQAWQAARERSPYFGPSRPRLPGPLGAAPHLPGDAPGDYGFDPLGLWDAADEGRRRWYAEAELLHGRWAMLAIVGCLIPEILDVSGVNVGEPVWWKVGAAKLRDGVSLNYAGIEGFRIAGNQGLGIIVACQVVLMGGPEYARYVGIKSLQPVGVFLPGTQTYPGGAPFDPAEFSRKPDAFLEQQVKEVKNGRLAMVAMLGLFAQAAVTRQGPVHNLLDML